STTAPSSNGARLSHSIASSFDFTCQSQKPAISSFVSVNGPSVTVRWPPLNFTRAPLELGCSPSPASITPAFTSCSLYLPIFSRISALGSAPVSGSALALTITMNRMSVPFRVWVGIRVSELPSNWSHRRQTLQLQDRPDLDGPLLSARNPPSDVERLV